MKRNRTLVLILCACFVSVAWAQQQAVMPRMGGRAIPRHRILNVTPNSAGLASNRGIGIQGVAAQNVKVWDLGTYPGGTWAEIHNINDFGVAVGWGDVPGGDIRMIGVPLFGPSAGEWFESGVSSNEVWSLEGVGISNTGIIVGHVKDANGEARAYAWTAGDQAGIDLGTLPGDDGSAAIAINNSGTLIVGNSYRWFNKKYWWATAVAWTLEAEWHNGRTTATWVIHALPSGGLEQRGKVFKGDVLDNWSGWGANDLGQIVGDAWTDKYAEIAVIWNPVRGGPGWEMQRLPATTSSPAGGNYAYTEALSINNQGDIVGEVSPDGWITTLPVLWTVERSKPVSWNLAELTTPSGGVAWGINNLGDVVGISIDASANVLATRWLTSDPGHPIIIGFPGDYSRAMGVNNLRIVVGRYRFGSGPMRAAAVAIQ